ncbi:MAG: AAA family ATPase [Deltaproteobacteria bacterium]|nr:AAA family ATPase [Deltaproteobacteria bacterium]
MKFSEVVAQTLDWLQREGRVSYRALKREFDLDDDYIEDLKTEIVQAKRLAVDEDGAVLVWTGAAGGQESENRGNGELATPQALRDPQTPNSKLRTTQPLTPSTQPPAERRQLTVMFCDLVGSTALSAKLDPEELREVIRAYQQTCTAVIQHHDGYIAQYLGDGLLVYFGYPTAHEDDARRAMRAGLEILAAIQEQVPSPLVEQASSLLAARMAAPPEGQGEGALQVRIGIHTGLVVIGDIGTSGRTEQLALGETPNIAARLQGLAEPNTVIISAATHRLIGGQFECQPFGSHLVKGITTPLAVYHVQSERQSVSPLAGKTTLTPLVGREQEVGLLQDRWEQVKEGRGQVVLLSGEPGIGKSRLAYTLKEQVTAEGSLLFESRCSPYYQHSALYPLIDVVQRTLLLTRQESDAEKIAKLERALALYGRQKTLPFFTALLSLPTPAQYPPLTLTPQKQKERTLQAMVHWLVAQAERQATAVVWEDLHWADPSSLEFLTLLIEQIPTTKLLLVLTFRPEFTPPWKLRSHLTQLTLNRLGKKHVGAMIEKAAAGKNLPAEVIEQIHARTDGVPLFVEELTKSVAESVGTVGATHASPLHLAIPATLQEALLARLDRLSSARQVAQLGATLGREFSYELLRAVAPTSAADLQTALAKLVEAEILYQRGMGEQIRYFFKHALIQDTAYQSLLKSTRQQYHQQIARVLEERFPDTKENQPELLAHHYTEAGLVEQAIPYWQQAGQRAVAHSAYTEAISQLKKGLALLESLPDTPERVQQELALQLLLGGSWQATKGYGAPQVESAYNRARQLCEQVGETSQLFPALLGLANFYNARGHHHSAYALSNQLLAAVQNAQDTNFLPDAHCFSTVVLWPLGEFSAAKEQAERVIDSYNPQQGDTHAFLSGLDPRVSCLSILAHMLWYLGYPEQALSRSQEALVLGRESSHIFSLSFTLIKVCDVHQCRGESQLVREWADTAFTLASEQGFALWSAWAILHRGWSLARQGDEEEGISQMYEGLATLRDLGVEFGRAWCLAWIAEACSKAGRVQEGLVVIAEAIEVMDKTGERHWEAELYRLKGELLLQSQAGPKQVEDKSKAS